jgi:Flp pilus assembly protein TadG
MTMRALNRLKNLFGNERGNALALGAAALPLVMASAGFAIDTIQLGVMKRQIQRAADSSAIAGAYAMVQDTNSTSEVATAKAAVARDLTKNKYPTLSQNATVTPGPALGYQRTVAVTLLAQPRLPFISIFTKAASPVTATATAAIVDNGRFCMLSLYNGTSPGIDIGGDATVNLGCGMASNSTGTEAITATGSSKVTASPLMAVGGLKSSTNLATGTKLQPYSSEQKDPFASVPNPPPQSGCEPLEVGPNDPPVHITPDKCYSKWDIQGTVTMDPGTYYVDGGDISFGSKANVSGNGVTIAMTGPNGAAGDLNMNAQATLDLKAPSSGTYAGILFFRDRRASNIEIKINGGADATLVGALYFPSSNVTFTGGSGFEARCFQLVGQILTFRGNAEINNSCPDFPGGDSFRAQYVRLVK